MSAIQKFKSGEEARAAQWQEAWSRGFNKAKVSRFLEEVSSTIKIPYPPGLYRFPSFEEAARFDLEQYIHQAVKK